jgi:hypothetical protein
LEPRKGLKGLKEHRAYAIDESEWLAKPAARIGRQDVFEKLGEPLVQRSVPGKETAIYNDEQGWFAFLYGAYDSYELVIRFETDLVSEAKLEEIGSG